MQRTVQDQDKPFILYVDDDPDDLDLFIYTISKINSSLFTQVFTDGREAFEFLESIPAGNRLPCLIILDLNMPDWNGLTTMEAIKKNKNYQHIPVLIFTTSDYPRHRESALSEGAVDFITKPYNLDDLKDICAVFANYCNGPVQLK